MSPEADPLRDTNWLAAYLGKPRGTLDNWAYRGEGPRFIKVGQARRYRQSDIDAWLDSNASTPRSAA